MKTRIINVLMLYCVLASSVTASELTASDIVKAAIDNWRGLSSWSEFSMTIHRPDWERSMRMVAWTEGDEMSLVRVTRPKKDAGYGSLLIDTQMWSFTPRINRVIKIPSSMMNQSWMGSDFTNRDISRADDILDLYDHTLLNTEQQDGHVVYTIESIPHEEAAVVWGKEILKVRDDHVLLSQDFIDQDGVLLKSMVTHEIEIMDGRPVAMRQRMS